MREYFFLMSLIFFDGKLNFFLMTLFFFLIADSTLPISDFHLRMLSEV